MGLVPASPWLLHPMLFWEGPSHSRQGQVSRWCVWVWCILFIWLIVWFGLVYALLPVLLRFNLLGKIIMTWRMELTVECLKMKLNHTEIEAIDLLSGWLVPGISHQRGDAPGGPPAVLSLWSVSIPVHIGCIPGSWTEESKAQDYVKSHSPWGQRRKRNEGIFKINKYTSQEKLFPRICRELPAIS